MTSAIRTVKSSKDKTTIRTTIMLLFAFLIVFLSSFSAIGLGSIPAFRNTSPVRSVHDTPGSWCVPQTGQKPMINLFPYYSISSYNVLISDFAFSENLIQYSTKPSIKESVKSIKSIKSTCRNDTTKYNLHIFLLNSLKYKLL